MSWLWTKFLKWLFRDEPNGTPPRWNVKFFAKILFVLLLIGSGLFVVSFISAFAGDYYSQYFGEKPRPQTAIPYAFSASNNGPNYGIVAGVNFGNQTINASPAPKIESTWWQTEKQSEEMYRTEFLLKVTNPSNSSPRISFPCLQIAKEEALSWRAGTNYISGAAVNETTYIKAFYTTTSPPKDKICASITL